MLGYFGVSIIHRTLIWTTGSLTCVCDIFACVYTRGGLGLNTRLKDFCIITAALRSFENNTKKLIIKYPVLKLKCLGKGVVIKCAATSSYQIWQSLTYSTRSKHTRPNTTVRRIPQGRVRRWNSAIDELHIAVHKACAHNDENTCTLIKQVDL